MGSIPGSGEIPWRRKWQPTPVLLPGESHGQRSLAGYGPQGHMESDTTEAPQCTELNTRGGRKAIEGVLSVQQEQIEDASKVVEGENGQRRRQKKTGIKEDTFFTNLQILQVLVRVSRSLLITTTKINSMEIHRPFCPFSQHSDLINFNKGK